MKRFSISFDEWILRKTEFSEKDFFDKAMSLTIGYDLKELREDHKVSYVGLTVPQAISYYDDECVRHDKSARLNYKLEFVFDVDCCHVSCWVDGCNEHYGVSHPLKLKEELEGIDDIPYHEKLEHMVDFADILSFFQ